LICDGGEPPADAQVDAFKPLLLKVRQGAYADIVRASPRSKNLPSMPG
jgi:hypothetical protein